MLERILSLSAASVNTLVSVVWKSAMVDNVTLIFVLYSVRNFLVVFGSHYGIFGSLFVFFTHLSTIGCLGELTWAPRPSSRSIKRLSWRNRRNRERSTSNCCPRTTRGDQVRERLQQLANPLYSLISPVGLLSAFSH